MNGPSQTKPTAETLLSRRSPNRRSRWRLAFAVSICLGAAIGIAAWRLLDRRAQREHDTVELSSAPRTAARSNRPSNPLAANSGDAHSVDGITLIDDDGRTLWASPTSGKPLDLAYLPLGVQIVVAMRPAALASHQEGNKVLAALGPIGRHAVNFLGEALFDPLGIDQLVVGCQITSDGLWKTVLVAHLTSPQTADEHLAAKLSESEVKVHDRVKYRLVKEWAYWVPESEHGRILVVAPPDAIPEIIDLAGMPPPMRRDVERLLARTDADRHITVLLAPNILFGEGRELFSGQMEPLRTPLFGFLGDELSAAALSMHWDENFFIELTATPTLDTSTERASKILAERVGTIPDRLEELVVGLNPRAYGRRVIARFPRMARKLSAYTRCGFDGDHAVLRCYLPVIAGHNLLMAAELTLAEAAASAPALVAHGSQVHSVTEVPAPSDGVSERLKRATSLVIARDTLQAALDLLSADIGVPIKILGADLQAEGITKNQPLGIHLTNRPAEDILVEVLRLANPDKTATGPSDVRQRLVYIISRPSSGNATEIVVTTRAAAAERGDDLPAVFRSVQP